jgi:hypothetical protein
VTLQGESKNDFMTIKWDVGNRRCIDWRSFYKVLGCVKLRARPFCHQNRVINRIISEYTLHLSFYTVDGGQCLDEGYP